MKKLFIAIIAIFTFSIASTAQNNDKSDQEYYIMLQKSGATATFNNLPRTMLEQLKQTMPNAPEGMLKEISDTMSVAIKGLVDSKMIPFYKENFTVAEIKEIIKFYDTPTGKKLAGMSNKIYDILPMINKEMIPLQQKVVTITQKWMNNQNK